MEECQPESRAPDSGGTIQCPQGCGAQIMMRDIEAHLRYDCSYRHVRCDQCGAYIVLQFRREHEAECNRWSIECGNDSPETGAIDDGHAEQHLGVCRSIPKSKCKYEYLGCKYVGYGKALEKHENCIYRHFRLMADGVSLFALQFDILEQKTKGDVLLLQNENFALREGIKEVLMQLERLRDADDGLTRKVDILQLGVRKLQAKRGNNRGSEDGRSTDVRNGGGDGEDEVVSIDRPAAHEDFASIMKLVQGLSTRVDNQDAIIEALSAGGQNDDGVLVWKIDGYDRLKAESMYGRRLSLSSRPFFTDRYGYKMCVKAFLGGDGEGRGSHLSLFMCMMRGPWDDVLPWPFRRRVTFRLLDRRDVDAGAKEDIREAFVPDPNLVSFRKPQTETNVGSGIARFVAHGVVENSGRYLIDDAIFVSVSVAAKTERDHRRHVR